MNESTPNKSWKMGEKHQTNFSASSIGSVAACRITKDAIGHVHSVFRRVINIEIPNEGLVGVVGNEIGKGPLYISIEIPQTINLTAIGVKQGNRVEISGKFVGVGVDVLGVSLEKATVWKPRNQLNGILDVPEIEVNLAELHKLLVHFGSRSSLFHLLGLFKSDFSDEAIAEMMNPVSRLALPQVKKLLAEINNSNSEGIMQSSRNLIGLGPGLTPAADDFLVGLMLIMSYITQNLGNQGITVQAAIKSIASCVRNRTTTISEEFLLQAADGNANEVVLSLIEALLTANPAEVERTAQRAMDYGGTSGIDIALGILFGAHMMLKNNLQKSDIF
jgi:hypothetical protein